MQVERCLLDFVLSTACVLAILKICQTCVKFTDSCLLGIGILTNIMTLVQIALYLVDHMSSFFLDVSCQ